MSCARHTLQVTHSQEFLIIVKIVSDTPASQQCPHGLYIPAVKRLVVVNKKCGEWWLLTAPE